MSRSRGSHATRRSSRTLAALSSSTGNPGPPSSSALPAHALSVARLHGPLDLLISEKGEDLRRVVDEMQARAHRAAAPEDLD